MDPTQNLSNPATLRALCCDVSHQNITTQSLSSSSLGSVRPGAPSLLSPGGQSHLLSAGCSSAAKQTANKHRRTGTSTLRKKIYRLRHKAQLPHTKHHTVPTFIDGTDLAAQGYFPAAAVRGELIRARIYDRPPVNNGSRSSAGLT